VERSSEGEVGWVEYNDAVEERMGGSSAAQWRPSDYNLWSYGGLEPEGRVSRKGAEAERWWLSGSIVRVLSIYESRRLCGPTTGQRIISMPDCAAQSVGVTAHAQHEPMSRASTGTKVAEPGRAGLKLE
jgi:hypothetical protein